MKVLVSWVIGLLMGLGLALTLVAVPWQIEARVAQRQAARCVKSHQRALCLLDKITPLAQQYMPEFQMPEEVTVSCLP